MCAPKSLPEPVEPSSTDDVPATGLDGLGDLTSFYLRAVNLCFGRELGRALAALPQVRGAGKVETLLMVAANPGIRPSVVARTLLKDPSAMVRLLDQLEQEGLLVRRVSDVERRSQALFLNAAGMALAARARQIVADCYADFCDCLDDDERRVLDGALRRLFDRHANGAARDTPDSLD